MASHDEKEEPDGEGLFSKMRRGLKGAIFTDDDEKPDKSAAPPPSNGKAAATLVVAPHAASPPTGGGAAPDPAIRAVLDRDVQIAAAPALTAFDAMCQELADVIPDEGMRTKAALKSILKHDPTHDLAAVLKDVDECLEALDKKSREKQEAMKAAIESRVGKRQQALVDIATSAADKRAKIIALEKEIAELEVRKNSEAAAIETERAEIERTASSFDATVAAYRAELTAKRLKIVSQGKGA